LDLNGSWRARKDKLAQRIFQGGNIPHFTCRAVIWLSVLLLMGLVLAFRALRQMPVVSRIRLVEDRLRGAV
jgi:hypothetical protein